ncbi:hypothetical protein H257_11681 [Aphanomyces astaci]|uniref:U6 snRNA-associated Sm-like protein LSm4 n=1 Tax=Aphanomyces astaci TaxID=112090 RepID=W4G3F9_APHAT|nr:hypothetical protein H257_11681 [Aphanomyces astaci]ETV73554.1 hypothetical protein H257_11681 [Aphanomyces astaci]|eukprot:XP_009836980.1 hypothetical protein H257_11681 [Aphanomyces astaci]
MLPLSLLQTAQGAPMLVELKSGDTYNGQLVNCDTWMNINLKEVICTAKDGDRFWKLPECYIRGNTIKYIRIPDEILDMVVEEDLTKKDRNSLRGRGRGGRGGVGSRGDGGGRGRGEGGRGRGEGGRGRGEGGGRGRGEGGRGRGDGGGRGRGEGRGRGGRDGSSRGGRGSSRGGRGYQGDTA